MRLFQPRGVEAFLCAAIQRNTMMPTPTFLSIPAMNPETGVWHARYKDRKLRVYYAVGPGDVVKNFEYWKQGLKDPRQVSLTYSSQFFSVARQLGIEAMVVGHVPPRGEVSDGGIRVRNAPRLSFGSFPLAFYLQSLVQACRTMWRVLRFRADVLVVASGESLFSFFAPLRLFGVRVIPSLHSAIHGKHQPLRGVYRAFVRRDAGFLARRAASVLCISDDIIAQIEDLVPGGGRGVEYFRPTFDPRDFGELQPPQWRKRPFRVMFSGRVEENKGVFDIVEMAQGLAAQGLDTIEFDICGDGGALPELRRRVKEAGLEQRVRCHGYCERPVMFAMLDQAHVVLVPTRTDFTEGFNKVLIEGILSGRPVITSTVCLVTTSTDPAILAMRKAVEEVPPEDVPAYTEAIRRLATDETLYQARLEATRAAQAPFYDWRQSWLAAFVRALDKTFPGVIPPGFLDAHAGGERSETAIASAIDHFDPTPP
jgi:glycosyltransferase involved in cell wall biosynthesis